MHKRSEIKAEIERLLKAKDLCSGRVFSNVIHRLQDSEIPFINIITEGEDSEIHNTSPRSYKKTYKFSVEVISEHDELEKELDLITGEIEKILCSNETLSGIVADTVLNSVDYGFEREGRRPQAGASMAFSSIYEQEVEYEENPDFKTMKSEILMGENVEKTEIELSNMEIL